jgi:uncharacterized protein YndB with AHSA1/START domain
MLSQQLNGSSPSADYTLDLDFAVPPERIFTAVTTMEGICRWWTVFCEVDEAMGGVSAYRFPSDGFFCVMKTVRKEPPRLLEWECVDSRHSAKHGNPDPGDWVGTRVRFEIAGIEACKTRLRFTHFGLAQLWCREACIRGWLFFLDESLRGYLECGAGKPWETA